MAKSSKPFDSRVLLGLAALGCTLWPLYGYAANSSPTGTSLIAAQNDIDRAGEKIKTRIKSADDIASPTLAFRPTVNSKPKQDIVGILDAEGQVFLPFGDVLRLFDFPIAIDPSQSSASGFFVNPEKTFKLDTEKLTVQIGPVHKTVTRQNFRKHNGQLYLSEEALYSWLGILSIFDRARLIVHFSTTYRLPADEHNLRKKKRLELLGPFSKTAQGTTSSPQPLVRLTSLSAQLPAGQVAEKHSFLGTTTAGFEVELYRNDTLIAFQYADENGKYAFEDIPLLLGENAFRLVTYGPQGQFDEKKEVLTSEPSLVKNFKTATAPASKAEEKEREKEKPKEAPPEKKAPPTMATVTGHEKMPIQEKNWTVLSVIENGSTIGKIESYIGVRGTFLRLDAFLRYIGIPYSQRTSSDIIEISAGEGRQIVIDIKQHVYTDQGKQHSLYDNDVFKNDEKIYANTDLIYRLFPLSTFLVDQAQQKITLPEQKKPETQPTAEKSDIAPTPTAAPVHPVIIDDLTGAQRLSGSARPIKDEPEAKDVLHVEQKAGDVNTNKDDDDRKNGEPLILQPKLKSLPASNEFIEALDYPDHVFLPMNDMFQIIGFPVKFDDTKNEARGFFFTPDNEFYLNVEKREARVAGIRYDLTRRDIRRRDGQPYISTGTFTEWFGITCEVNRPKGILVLKTDRLLPEEEKQQRQKQWSKLLGAVQQPDKNFPVLENGYQALSYPTLDVLMGSTFRHDEMATSSQKNSADSNYNIQGSMDMAYLTNQFYVQGATETKTINSIRLQAGRKDPNSNLLGGMQASEFAIGDVSSPSVSFVTGNSLGRGATITNRDVTSAENFDMRSFTGDSIPGYEVELYRNNVLLTFQTVDASGRYNFTDIPILYGENTFRIVFYGPQGQREERIEKVSASSALLKEGNFEYTLGALERGTSLIPINQKESTSSFAPNGAQMVGGFRYGVTSNYTIGAAAAETRLRDGPHRYLTTSSGANMFGFLSETSFAKDMTSGGWASGMSALTGFEGISLRARYRRYNNFMSETANNTDLPLKSEARVDANTQVVLPLLHDFSLGLSGLREEFADDTALPRYTYGLRLSKSFWGLSFTNTVDYILSEDKRFQDTFGVQTRVWDVNFRATGIYDVMPKQQFRSASFTADYALTSRLSGQSQIDKDMTTNKTSFGQGINWDFDEFRLSLNNDVDNRGDYSVGMNLLFSLNHDKVANKWRAGSKPAAAGGAIAGRVFVDENDNGIFDENEKMVTDATVRVNRAAATLDENGYFVSPVTAYETVKVELMSGEGTDPLLTPATKGYRVQTRPGDTVVADFPLVHTTVIDGTSYFHEKSGAKRDLGNIVIDLLDKDLKPIRRVVSEIDGYYSFDKIQKGEYWISVPDEVLSALNASLKSKVHIKVDEISSFVTGNDIILEQREDLTAPPILTTPAPALPAIPARPNAPTPPTIPTLEKEEKGSRKEKPEDPEKPENTTKDNKEGGDQHKVTPPSDEANAVEIMQ